MEDKAPFFDMPDQLQSKINYTGKYKHAELPKSYPCNEAAKRVPSASDIYKGIYRR